jgi:4-alpha-glucanotransferase
VQRARICKQTHWPDDHALFRAPNDGHDNACYLDWPAELIHREPAHWIRGSRFAQFLLYQQGARLREYARDKGIRLRENTKGQEARAPMARRAS